LERRLPLTWLAGRSSAMMEWVWLGIGVITAVCLALRRDRSPAPNVDREEQGLTDEDNRKRLSFGSARHDRHPLASSPHRGRPTAESREHAAVEHHKRGRTRLALLTF
jgi:hypothetical protein